MQKIYLSHARRQSEANKPRMSLSQFYDVARKQVDAPMVIPVFVPMTNDERFALV